MSLKKDEIVPESEIILTRPESLFVVAAYYIAIARWFKVALLYYAPPGHEVMLLWIHILGIVAFILMLWVYSVSRWRLNRWILGIPKLRMLPIILILVGGILIDAIF